MFKYNYVEDLFKRLINKNDLPLQVELQPGSHCGPFRCTYCYSTKQPLNEGLLTIDDYSQLLDDLTNKTELIEISGVASDPLSYPDFYTLLKLIKKRKFNFGIHTKGFFLNEKIIKLLNTKPTGNFITLNVDSANNDTYNKLHGLPPNAVVFDRVKQTIMSLYKEKLKKRSELRINVAYLLLKNNSSREEIDQFIQTFRNHCDIIKFSTPQVPHVADPVNFLNAEETNRILNFVRNYETHDVVVLKARETKRENNFKYCWTQRFNATIDKAGNVFPCPQVALKPYIHLRYGNIKEKRFWDIWNSERRKKILNMLIENMKCGICDRKDEAINIELNSMLNNEK